jgi:hypothetical protein
MPGFGSLIISRNANTARLSSTFVDSSPAPPVPPAPPAPRHRIVSGGIICQACSGEKLKYLISFSPKADIKKTYTINISNGSDSIYSVPLSI